METDDDDNPPWFETGIEPAVKRGFELFELIVDGNPQRLKNARGGVAAVGMPSAARRALAAGESLGEIAAGANRLAGAERDKISGKPAAVWFLAIALEDLGKLLFIESRQKRAGRLSPRRVESQVERARARETEAAGLVGQLIRRKPQIEQNPVDGRNRKARENLGKLGITGVDEVGRTARELTGRNVQHQGIAVKTD